MLLKIFVLLQIHTHSIFVYTESQAVQLLWQFFLNCNMLSHHFNSWNWTKWSRRRCLGSVHSFTVPAVLKCVPKDNRPNFFWLKLEKPCFLNKIWSNFIYWLWTVIEERQLWTRTGICKARVIRSSISIIWLLSMCQVWGKGFYNNDGEYLLSMFYVPDITLSPLCV